VTLDTDTVYSAPVCLNAVSFVKCFLIMKVFLIRFIISVDVEHKQDFKELWGSSVPGSLDS
jgi:hypothetical protein